ncbi:MAG: iron-containing alcohol dehydrogenase [Thermodesulfobacteriota bacterium]|nr:iron-containing alcohol dehydrogenase [Thermodesulfobacteriota bacterium]
MKFEFATVDRIIFGAGKVNEILSAIPTCNQNICVITGKNLIRAEPVTKQLEGEKIDFITIQVDTEPTVDKVNAGVNRAREAGCRCVVGIGGGSVLDTGKVIAALLTNEGELFEYLEVIGKGNKLVNPSVPYIAIPTTAGTGAEVTRNSVLMSSEHKVKVSMRSPSMLPLIAIIDPELTYSMPPSITAHTGLDAYTQVLEAFVSTDATPLTDGICREGLRRAAGALERAYRDGSDIKAREDMCLASLCGGLALANAKLGAVHGIAGPLGGMFTSPHGAVCGRLLPYVISANISALRNRLPTSPALARYDEIARIIIGNPQAVASDGIRWTHNLCNQLKMTPLSEYGIDEKDFSDIIKKSQRASSMQGNPVRLTENELYDILQQAL